MIDSFGGKYRFLSNFYSHATLNGLTVEHFYQAAKTLDPARRVWVMQASSPYQAKKRGRQLSLRSDWEQVKVPIMLNLLRVKFEPGTELATWLLETGEQELVEGNHWHDLEWGCCNCPKHGGQGKNLLGKLLMMVREELR